MTDFGAVGGLIKIGTLVWQAVQLHSEAPERYRQLTGDLLSVLGLLDAVEDTLAKQTLTPAQQTQLQNIWKNCTGTLNKLQYATIRHRSRNFVDELLAPGREDVKEIRERLTLSLQMVNIFIHLLHLRVEPRPKFLEGEDGNNRRLCMVLKTREKTETTWRDCDGISILEVGYDINKASRSSSEASSLEPISGKSKNRKPNQQSTAPKGLSKLTLSGRARYDHDAEEKNQESTGTLPNMSTSSISTLSTPKLGYNTAVTPSRSSLVSQRTVSSDNSSMASLERTVTNTQDKFIAAAKSGDTTLLLVWLKRMATRSQLDPDSLNIALLELSKNAKHNHRRAEVVKLLLDLGEGLDVECRDERGCTPLMCAAFHGHVDVVQLLLEKGVDVLAVDEKLGRNALMWAARSSWTSATRCATLILLSDHASSLLNTTDVDAQTALSLSYTPSRQNTQLATLLLHHGADPSTTIPPLLLTALAADNEPLVQLILERGTDPQCADADGVPALSLAMRRMSRKVVELMLDRGAGVEKRDEKGRTPLMWAISYRRTAVVKLLVERGADCDAVDGKDEGVREWAERSKVREIIELFARNGP